jgi:LysW-gamma-L-lysine carboxypeptidase
MSHSAGQLASGPEIAVEFWNTLTRHAAAYNEGHAVFDTLDTSLRSIQTSSDGLQEVVTQRIGLRLPLDYDVAALQTYLREQAGAATLHFSGYEVAHKSDKRNPLVKAFLKTIREHGGDPKFKVKTGTSDMNVLAPHWHCPVVAYGPGDSALDHTPHEHISLQEYLRAIDILTRVLHLLIEASPATA